MNTEERKYRFTEIMSAVSMLPDLSMDDKVAFEEAEKVQEWVLPNLTKGLDDNVMKDAILCQAFRENEEFKFKLIALLTNSAQRRIMEAREQDTNPTDEDLQALAISANILWAEGQAKGLFQVLGLLGSVCGIFDMEVPALSTAFLRSNASVEHYGKLDPIAILSGNVSSDDVENAMKDGE